MSYISIFCISFAVALSGALAPGPFLATVIFESAKQGYKTGPLMIVGHMIIEIIMVGALVLGLGKIVADGRILCAVSILGSFILIVFGLRMLFSVNVITQTKTSIIDKKRNLTVLGIMMSVANPYWSIWWLTIGLGLVLSAYAAGLRGLLVFFAGHILADFIWYGTVSLLTSKGKNVLNEKAYKTMLMMCALTLVGFGIYFGVRSGCPFLKNLFT